MDNGLGTLGEQTGLCYKRILDIRIDVGGGDSQRVRYEVRRGDCGAVHGRKRAEWAAAYLCSGQHLSDGRG